MSGNDDRNADDRRGADAAPSARNERLRAALRANLARRKAQARARAPAATLADAPAPAPAPAPARGSGGETALRDDG